MQVVDEGAAVMPVVVLGGQAPVTGGQFRQDDQEGVVVHVVDHLPGVERQDLGPGVG